MSLLAGEPIATGTHEPRTAVRASGPGRRVSYWIAAAFLLVALLYAGRQLWRETTQPRPNAASTATGPTSESQGLVQKAKALIDDDLLAVRESFRTAADLCERAVTLDAASTEGWATLSRANRTLRFFYNEGGAQRLDDVRRQAERGMRLAPDSAEAQLAMALYESILPAGAADARKRLEELWRQHPDDRRIPRALAVLAQQSRDVEATRIWAERADSLPGGDPYALAQIAWGAWVRGRIEEVGPALERFLARGPTSAALHLQLRLRYALGDFDGAGNSSRVFPRPCCGRTASLASRPRCISRGANRNRHWRCCACRQEPHFGHSIALVIGG